MSTTTNNFPEAGTFDWMRDRHSAEMVESAYKGVSLAEGWEFLKTFVPEAGKGFMFSDPPAKLQQINIKIGELYDDHSGCSYGWTMRQIEDIAKNGWEAWVTRVRSWRSEQPASVEMEAAIRAQPTEEEMVGILRRLRERGEQMRQEFVRAEAAAAAEAAARISEGPIQRGWRYE